MIKDIIIITARLNSDIHCLNQMIKMIPVIRDQVKEFDGKVFNIRLANAINEDIQEFGRIEIRRLEYNSSKMFFYPHERQITYTDIKGKSAWMYSDLYSHQVLYCDQVFVPQRINAAEIIPFIDSFANTCIDQIRRIESDKLLLSEMILLREKTMSIIEKYNNSPQSYTGRDELKIRERK